MCFSGQPLHPLKHALQIFTDTSKEGWGAHLNEHTARGTWSLPESKLNINHLELKVVFLALKEFQDLCSNTIVLVATDNTTVVAYINKEGGMKLGSLCALLWRILSWCTRKKVTVKSTSHPRPAERDGRQAIQVWPDHSNGMVPSSIVGVPSSWWHQPQVDPDSTTNYHSLSHRSQTPRHGQWMHSVCPGRIWSHMPSHH